MEAQANVVIMFSHNHIKITAKLKNNHYSELPKTELNRGTASKNIKQKPYLDW